MSGAVFACNIMDSLRRSSVKIGTIQRRLAWPLRKDDTVTLTHTHTLLQIEKCNRGLFLQAQEGNIHFTELHERVENGNYGVVTSCRKDKGDHSRGGVQVVAMSSTTTCIKTYHSEVLNLFSVTAHVS